MLLLGIDIGTSSIKTSVVDAETKECIISVQHPETETPVIVPKPGWAEQLPMQWWQDVQESIVKAHASKKYDPKNIAAIGVAYQMHGLVLVDEKQNILRNSIIWCDSRAVKNGNKAWKEIGKEKCLCHLLNSPGNFTASKLAWVKKNEPEVYKKIYKMMLPGDFISMKLTGEITTTVSALSEGIFWDFARNKISREILNYFHFDENIIPTIAPVFSTHGLLSKEAASQLSLRSGIPVSYKAGDQLNNALSLNVLNPGELAATAGTSGVIYAVTDKLFADESSRVNAFAHINHTKNKRRLGVLLCINGTGIMNSWIKNLSGKNSYAEMDELAAQIPPGSDGLIVLPFGNGAERMLQNKIVEAQILNIDLNKHTKAHLYRATQEGIAFAFRYGLDIMKENGLEATVIRAGNANMFLSDVFVQSFVNATGVPVELYANDGSVGAALGAGIGAGIFKSYDEALSNLKILKRVEVSDERLYDKLYEIWKKNLCSFLS